MRISVLTDEISDDLCAALDLVKQWHIDLVELRSMWGKNIVDLTPEERKRVRLALHRRGLAVDCLAAPAFKCAWNGGHRPVRGATVAARTEMADGLAVLERAIAVATSLGARMVRGFSFWRVMPAGSALADIVPTLQSAAALAAAHGLTLVIENEHSCNAATGAEVARLVELVDRPNCAVLWDPANALVAGERAFPNGYDAVRGAVANVHVKDAVQVPEPGEEPWRLLGQGQIDWSSQIGALAADGYRGPLTLEPHPIAGLTREDAAFRSVQRLRRLLHEVEQKGCTHD